jgi:hypothetical protein
MKPTKPVWEVLCLLVAGYGVGWLLGLSVSPVAQSLLTALLGILTAIIAGLSGLTLPKPALDKDDVAASKTPQSPIVTAVPFGLVMFGIILGSATGVFCRKNNILGFQPDIFIQRWKALSAVDKQQLRGLPYVFEYIAKLQNLRQQLDTLSQARSLGSGDKMLLENQLAEIKRLEQNAVIVASVISNPEPAAVDDKARLFDDTYNAIPTNVMALNMQLLQQLSDRN